MGLPTSLILHSLKPSLSTATVHLLNINRDTPGVPHAMATWAKTGQAWGGGSDGRHKGKTNNKKNVYKCSPVLLFISSSNDKPARKRLELGRTGAKRRRSELHLHQARQSDTWEEKTINTGTRNKGKPAAGGRYAKS